MGKTPRILSGVCCLLLLQGSGPAYSAEAMATKLATIPLEGKTIEEVADAVKDACREERVLLVRADSKKSKGAGSRVTVVGLVCKHGVANRQAAYRQKVRGEVQITSCFSPHTCFRSLFAR